MEIRILLTGITVSLRSGHRVLDPFESNIGTRQGDSLSPVLFTVCLEAAFHDLSSSIAVPHDLLQQMVVYADDADFVCQDQAAAAHIAASAFTVLARWSLLMNPSKTELTVLQRHVPDKGAGHCARANAEAWYDTPKLGLLLGDTEDASHRKQLATIASTACGHFG